jgi:hypothetical protein
MGFLRNVVSDLVEKRLWPVAVLLVLAVAAVPVLLGGADPEPAATAALPPASAEAPSRGQIAVDVPVPANRERKGELRDPFRQPKAEAAASVPSTATAPAAPAGSAPATPEESVSPPSSATPPSSGPSTPPATGPVEPSTPRPAAPKADPLDAYRITLRFGEAGKVKTRRDLARLTPLPSADDPFFVFLGVLEGGKRAVFLVSADATPTGDGVCKPRPTSCETLELRVGDTEFFDLERESGPVQYELQLRSIRKDGDASPSEAVAARARASKAGAEVLKTADPAAVEGIDGYRFSRDTGLLERTPVASRSRVRTAGAARADVPAPAPAVPADAAPAAAAAAAAAAASAADPAPEARRQDRRTRAAVRAIVSGVAGALPARR